MASGRRRRQRRQQGASAHLARRPPLPLPRPLARQPRRPLLRSAHPPQRPPAACSGPPRPQPPPEVYSEAGRPLGRLVLLPPPPEALAPVVLEPQQPVVSEPQQPPPRLPSAPRRPLLRPGCSEHRPPQPLEVQLRLPGPSVPQPRRPACSGRLRLRRQEGVCSVLPPLG